MTHKSDALVEGWERNGLMTMLERWAADEEQHAEHLNWRCPTCGGGDVHTFGCATRGEDTYRTEVER